MSERPPAPAAAHVAVVAALLLAAGAIAASMRVDSDWLRLLIAVATLAAGLALHGAQGNHVTVGIRDGATLLGAYLAGVAIVALDIPDQATPGYDGPSPTVVLLLTFGLPALALLGSAARGVRAGALGAGLVLVMLTSALLIAWGVDAAPLALAMLAVAALGLGAAALAAPDSLHGTLAAGVAAMAASVAIGAGSSPVGSLASSAGFGRSGDGGPPDGVLSPGMQAVVLVLGVAIAALAVALAFLRRDAGGGTVAASALAVPPVWVLIAELGERGGSDRTPGQVALIAVPVLAAAIAGALLARPQLRARAAALLPRAVRPPAIEPGAALAAIACALLVLATLALPALDWSERVEGAVALVLLVGAGAIGLVLRGTAGATVAGATLAALWLATPWWGLFMGDPSRGESPADRILLVGLVGLAAACAASALLVSRHPRPGVFAAGAYAIVGNAALALWKIVGPGDFAAGLYGHGDQLAAVVVLLGPLLLVGVPAAVAAHARDERLAAGGQAVGALVLAIGAFTLLRRLYEIIGVAGGARGNAVSELSFFPLTPTDAFGVIGSIREAEAAAFVGIGLIVVLGFVLALSLVRRASAPLMATSLLLVVASAQTTAYALIERGDTTAIDIVIWTLLGAGVLLAAASRLQLAGRSTS